MGYLMFIFVQVHEAMSVVSAVLFLDCSRSVDPGFEIVGQPMFYLLRGHNIKLRKFAIAFWDIDKNTKIVLPNIVKYCAIFLGAPLNPPASDVFVLRRMVTCCSSLRASMSYIRVFRAVCAAVHPRRLNSASA
jgi:hypothetical protein